MDSFVAVGASSGERDKVSRRQLIDEAHHMTAWNFTSTLLLRLRDKYKWNLPKRRDDDFLGRKLFRSDPTKWTGGH